MFCLFIKTFNKNRGGVAGSGCNIWKSYMLQAQSLPIADGTEKAWLQNREGVGLCQPFICRNRAEEAQECMARRAAEDLSAVFRGARLCAVCVCSQLVVRLLCPVLSIRGGWWE